MINEQSVIVASVGLVGGVIWGVLRTRKMGAVRETTAKRHVWWCVLFAAYVCSVCSVTLFPILLHIGDEPIYSANLVPFGTISALVASQNGVSICWNLVGNVLIFVPLGFLGPLACAALRKPGILLGVSIVFSCTIEILQYLEVITRLASNRVIDIDDVVLNVAGAMLGSLLSRAVSLIALTSREQNLNNG